MRRDKSLRYKISKPLGSEGRDKAQFNSGGGDDGKFMILHEEAEICLLMPKSQCSRNAAPFILYDTQCEKGRNRRSAEEVFKEDSSITYIKLI